MDSAVTPRQSEVQYKNERNRIIIHYVRVQHNLFGIHMNCYLDPSKRPDPKRAVPERRRSIQLTAALMALFALRAPFLAALHIILPRTMDGRTKSLPSSCRPSFLPRASSFDLKVGRGEEMSRQMSETSPRPVDR